MIRASEWEWAAWSAEPARAELGMALSTLRLRGRDEALAVARNSLARHPENPALAELVRNLSARR